MDERLQRIERYWSQRAPSFDDEPDHGLADQDVARAWEQLLDDLVPAGAVDVLDLGCGTGSLSLVLARWGRRVVGIDISRAMVDAARAKTMHDGVDATFLIGDASVPPVTAGNWDVVLARHVVWTLLDPAAAIQRWCHLLRPGGRLVLIEGRWVSETAPADSPPPGDGGFTAAQLTELIEGVGDVVEMRPLSEDTDLWGRPVDDERYAMVVAPSPNR